MLRLILLFVSLNTIAQQTLNIHCGLPEGLDEASGLLMLNGRLFVHNDSGGETMIYEINGENNSVEACNLLASYPIVGSENEDWEDITADENYIYIADIGNNSGSRQNLKIYKINKQELLNGVTPQIQEIRISYASQTSFEPANHATEYDAEALVSIGDSLYLFSKNWSSFSTTVYRIPKTPGNFSLSGMANYQVNALITGADYHEQTRQLALCGYSFFGPVLFRAEIEQGSDLRNTVFISDNLIVEASAQVEGICFNSDGSGLFLSAENDKTGPAVIYSLFPDDASILRTEDIQLTIYPNPASDKIFLRLQKQNSEVSQIKLSDVNGNFFPLKTQENKNNSQINLPDLNPGLYFLSYRINGTARSSRIIIQ